MALGRGRYRAAKAYERDECEDAARTDIMVSYQVNSNRWIRSDLTPLANARALNTAVPLVGAAQAALLRSRGVNWR